MGYDWKDDYVVDGKLKDGWYYIRPWEDMENEFGLDEDGGIKCNLSFVRSMEEELPPTRCIEVINGCTTTNYRWCISPDMITSPALTIGKEYEFSDNGEDWEVFKFTGYDFSGPYHYFVDRVRKDSWFKYCREIKPEPEKKYNFSVQGEAAIEITLAQYDKIKKILEI